MAPQTFALDVRNDIRSGREPFGKIMQLVSGLQVGDQLLLLAPFEPVPLYGVLAQRGFSHETKPIGGGEFEVRFTRDAIGQSTPSAVAPAPMGVSHRVCPGKQVVDVDARGLEPPQPLVKILEALASLPLDAWLRARTDRRPMHLYAQLSERGFAGESEPQPDGSYVTYVHRP